MWSVFNIGKVLVFGALGLLSSCLVAIASHLLWVCYRNKKNRKSADPDAVDQSILPGEEYKQIIDIWKASVEVQQHFNDLELRIRNFAVTLLVGVLGATAFALKEHYVISLFGFTLSLAVGICLAGVPGLMGFYLMDRHWYHRLLLGAVSQTVKIEKKFSEKIPELSLTHAIGGKSPVTWGPFEIHSSEKIDIFYCGGLAILLLLSWLLLLIGTDPPQPMVIQPPHSERQSSSDHSGQSLAPKDGCWNACSEGKVQNNGKTSQKSRDLGSR